MEESILTENRARPSQLSKENLFSLILLAKRRTLVEFARTFNLPTVTEQAYGFDPGHPDEQLSEEKWAQVIERTRVSLEWRCFNTVHDFAVDGIYHESVNVYAMLMDASNMARFFMAANPFETKQLDQLVDQAWARHEMEVGGFVRFDPFVRLAGVDARTVRNAISAGDLVFHKNDGNGLIEGASAKRWLTSRRGFKPTRMIHSYPELATICTPAAFVQFLRNINAQRLNDGFYLEPPASSRAMLELENGAFNLPLDAVNPLADYYGVSRKEFLKCVMRVFFAAQYQALLAEEASR